jgi:poly(A) polymerase
LAGDDQLLALPPLLRKLRPLFAAQELPVHVVGGVVRDALLGEVSTDLDFVVPEGAIALAYAVGDALSLPAYVLDRERDTGRVVVPGRAGGFKTTLDFARYRADGLEGDLRARDFTINAMALPAAADVAAAIIDPLNGRGDLAAGLLRLAYPEALADDPVRTLRALRMAARFGFELEPATEAAIVAAAERLPSVSEERVRDELVKLFISPVPHEALQMLHDYQLLPVVLPEIAALDGVEQSAPHHEPVLAHTISTLRWLVAVEQAVDRSALGEGPLAQVQARLLGHAAALRDHFGRRVTGDLNGWHVLRWSALFHDAGKAATQQRDESGRVRFFGHDVAGSRQASRRLKQLRFGNEAIDHVKATVAVHMRPLLLAQEERVTRRAVYRYFRAGGTAGLDAGILSLADHLATHGGTGPDDSWERLLDVVTGLFHHFFEAHADTIAPPPLLDGRALMAALSLAPGPEVGRLLAMLEEAQAAGEIATHEEAVALAREAHQK